MAKTEIPWATDSWNPVSGCTKCSPGCLNCYAEKMAKRLQAMGAPGYENGFQVTLHPGRLREPMYSKNPKRYFVCSMGDLFHDSVPDDFIESVFATMEVTPRHTYMLLTKRPERMAEFVNHPTGKHLTRDNVWFGVTAENQEQADKRIPVLLSIPAAVRFISAEPLLGPLDISQHLKWVCIGCDKEQNAPVCECGDYAYGRLDWVIAGSESGANRRPAGVQWFRNLRDQCRAAGVPYFLKQIEVDGKLVKMPFLDGKQWAEFP